VQGGDRLDSPCRALENAAIDFLLNRDVSTRLELERALLCADQGV
jgi:hypothetical protein